MSILNKPIYAFIDASNIIYGTMTKDGNDWKIDFEKLFYYLKERYQVDKIFYFGGIDKNNKKQRNFYLILGKIGYILILKKAKYYIQKNGLIVKKANCDVDLTFYLMKTIEEYSGIIHLSGDGDFFLVLQHLLHKGISVKVIANGKRTAKEIKQLVGSSFTDINTLRVKLQFKKRTH